MRSSLFLKRLLALPVVEVLAVVEAMNFEDGGLVHDEENARPGGCVITRLAAGECGFWKDCVIPGCRRARACRGKLTAAQIQHGSGYHPYFPPCTRANEDRRQTILRMMGRMPETTADDTAEFRDLERRLAEAARLQPELRSRLSAFPGRYGLPAAPKCQK
jgi:hypothetical protein